MSTLTDVATPLLEASRPEDVFGHLPGGETDQLAALKRLYRRLSRVIHPDNNPGDSRAGELFSLLNKYHVEAMAAINDGSYGKDRSVLVKTKRHEHRIGRKVASLGAAVIYDGRMDGVIARYHAASSSVDNDLMQAEVASLKLLRSPDRPEASGYLRMLPELIDSFQMQQDAERLAVNVFAAPNGFVGIDEVCAAYPEGLDPRDMAWIWRRLLDVLGYVHARGVIHGAVLPGRVQIGLGDVHDVILTGWQYSLIDPLGSSQHLIAVDSNYRDWYPSSVYDKEVASPYVDISMAARCCLKLIGADPVTALGSRAPRPIIGFLQSCLKPGLSSGPNVAWRLREEFGKLAIKLWGPHTYRPLNLPA